MRACVWLFIPEAGKGPGGIPYHCKGLSEVIRGTSLDAMATRVCKPDLQPGQRRRKWYHHLKGFYGLKN